MKIQVALMFLGIICASMLVNAEPKSGLRIICPADKVMYSDKLMARLNWDRVKTVNAPGAKYPPRIGRNRRPGQMARVPGVYLIKYTAKDQLGNVAKCNFTVTVKRPSCKLPKLPQNGVLVCDKEWEKTKKNMFCAIMCKDGYDVPHRQTIMRICTNRVWKDFPFMLKQAGPTDCSAKGKGNLPPLFYYKGNITKKEVRAKVKKSFRRFLKTSTGICFVAQNNECEKGEIEIFHN